MNVPRVTRNWRKRARSGQRGQAIVEFTLALPIFCLLLYGAVDFGRAIYTYSTITNAARQGARYGIIAPTSTAAIQAKVQQAAPTLGLASSAVSVTCSNGCASAQPGDLLTVGVTYHFVPLAALIAASTGANLTLATSTTMAIE